jgi:Ca2+-binding RTX toxin-like protein
VLVVLLPLLAGVSAETAAAAPPTCQGVVATITGDGGTVTGTEGNDVISTSGKATVDALGGDDLICAERGTVLAGPGADSVYGTPDLYTVPLAVDLGPGDDVLVGGKSEVTVYGDGSGRDVITTGPNDDIVTSGVDGEPNLDVLHLGDGDDQLSVRLPDGSDVVADLGRRVFRENTVQVVGADTEAGEWSLDYHEVVRDGETLARLSGVDVLGIRFGPQAHVTVTGTPKREVVELYSGDVDIDLLGGRDDLSREREDAGPVTGEIQGGPGDDDLDLLYGRDSTFRGDLTAGRVTADSDVLAVDSFEWVFAVAGNAVLQGRGANETLGIFGCTVRIEGRGGNDWLNVSREPNLHCATRRAVLRGGAGTDYLWGDSWPVRMEGGPGDDFLFGGERNDVLIGGPGDDKADGSSGHDVCRTEWRRSCER